MAFYNYTLVLVRSDDGDGYYIDGATEDNITLTNDVKKAAKFSNKPTATRWLARQTPELQARCTIKTLKDILSNFLSV